MIATNSSFYIPQNETRWHRVWNSLQPKLKYGFKIGGTKANVKYLKRMKISERIWSLAMTSLLQGSLWLSNRHKRAPSNFRIFRMNQQCSTTIIFATIHLGILTWVCLSIETFKVSYQISKNGLKNIQPTWRSLEEVFRKKSCRNLSHDITYLYINIKFSSIT